MDRKYQVFISSTYRDLIKERQKVIEGILQQDCIPICMESFSASYQSQIKMIRQLISDCDYFFLILAGKYGSIHEETNISFTEMEFNMARELGKPIFVFYRDLALIPDELQETDGILRAAIQKFHSKATSQRLARSWVNPDDLKAQVIGTLSKTMFDLTVPAQGWIKAPLITYESKDDVKRKDDEVIKWYMDTMAKYIEQENATIHESFTCHISIKLNQIEDNNVDCDIDLYYTWKQYLKPGINKFTREFRFRSEEMRDGFALKRLEISNIDYINQIKVEKSIKRGTDEPYAVTIQCEFESSGGLTAFTFCYSRKRHPEDLLVPDRFAVRDFTKDIMLNITLSDPTNTYKLFVDPYAAFNNYNPNPELKASVKVDNMSDNSKIIHYSTWCLPGTGCAYGIIQR